ncbi:MAG TPA: hypothetical protein PLP29_16175 [Candidatus Ozemobacteraceae bacterium]|nr:hypothetical protein [Candidatus Ozemobacteraceae bacterium]
MVPVKIELWPELARLVTSNNVRKKLETLQNGVDRAYSSQELPIFRFILDEGAHLFRLPREIEQLNAVFPQILAATYQGSEATPLGHERSYDETRIRQALKTATSPESFFASFAVKLPASSEKKLFRRILAAEIPGGTSPLSNERDRYEARLCYRSLGHLREILKTLGIEPKPPGPDERRRLRNTCREIVGIPDLAQPEEVSVLDLPVRLHVDGRPDGTGEIRLMILDDEIPADRCFSLPDRIHELETRLSSSGKAP